MQGTHDYIMLAKLFGVSSVVLALGILFNLDNAKTMAQALVDSAAGYVMAGVLPVIFGAWLVIEHNVWVLDWPIAVTLVGWVMLFAGIFRVIFVGTWISVMSRHIDRVPVLFSLFGLMFGLLLIYVGFFSHLL